MKLLLIILLLAITFSVSGGCNSGTGNNPQPTPSPTPIPTPTPSPNCIPIEGDFEQLSEFVDCPTEGLIQICNNYICAVPDFEAPDPIQVGIIPLECTAIDCFTAECELLGDSFEEVVGSGVFTIDEILGNSNFAGTVIIDEGDVMDYECSPIVP